MDIGNLLAVWKRFFCNEHTNTRLPSQDAEIETPEATFEDHDQPKASGDTGDGSDGGFSEPENADNGLDHEVDEAPEAPEAPDNSNPDNSASDDGKDTNNDNGIARRFRFFSGASAWIAAKAEVAALQVYDSVISAVNILKKKGVFDAAKDLKDWVQEHPWQTALFVVPLVTTACVAIALLATGFGPAGIVAGSAAAAIQAGIGNVVAGSLFAICTSAMMGGFGAPIIFGGTWALATVAVAAAKAFRTWWNSPNERRVVRVQTEPSRSVSRSLEKVADTVIFHSALIVAVAVYYVKSKMQARRQRPDDEPPLL